MQLGKTKDILLIVDSYVTWWLRVRLDSDPKYPAIRYHYGIGWYMAEVWEFYGNHLSSSFYPELTLL